MAKPQNRLHKEESTLFKEEQAFKLRVQGWSQPQIAEELQMTQQGVSKALKRITKRFAKQFLDDVKVIKHEQVAQLENVAHEAMEAWYKSKEAHKKNHTKVKGAATKEGAKSAETNRFEEDQYGDPRYLGEFRKAKEDIRKILGTQYIEDEGDEPITEIKINIIQPETTEENES